MMSAHRHAFGRATAVLAIVVAVSACGSRSASVVPSANLSTLGVLASPTPLTPTASPTAAPSIAAATPTPGPAAARNATLVGPTGLVFDAAGNLYVSGCSWTSSYIYRIDPSGMLTTYAGAGATAFSGDGGLALAATLQCPGVMAIAPDGALVFRSCEQSDPAHGRRRRDHDDRRERGAGRGPRLVLGRWRTGHRGNSPGTVGHRLRSRGRPVHRRPRQRAGSASRSEGRDQHRGRDRRGRVLGRRRSSAGRHVPARRDHRPGRQPPHRRPLQQPHPSGRQPRQDQDDRRRAPVGSRATAAPRPRPTSTDRTSRCSTRMAPWSSCRDPDPPDRSGWCHHHDRGQRRVRRPDRWPGRLEAPFTESSTAWRSTPTATSTPRTAPRWSTASTRRGSSRSSPASRKWRRRCRCLYDWQS